MSRGSRSQEMMPSTLDIPWLRRRNTLIGLDLRVKVTRNVAHCPLHHITNAHTEFKLLRQKVMEEMHLQEKSIIDP